MSELADELRGIAAGLDELFVGPTDTPDKIRQAADALKASEARVGELEKLARELERAESRYRIAHDIHGGSSLETGRAWDLMRRAGDYVRQALAAKEAVDEAD